MAAGGLETATLAFATAAAVLVVLTFGLAFLVAWARKETLERLRAGAPRIKRWGGAVLLVVGTWVFVLGLFAEAFATAFPV